MDDSMMCTSKTSHDAITMMMMTSQSSVEITIIACSWCVRPFSTARISSVELTRWGGHDNDDILSLHM